MPRFSIRGPSRFRPWTQQTWLLVIVVLAACGGGVESGLAPVPESAAAPGASPAAVPPATEQELRVIFLGDSLAAGHGLPSDLAFPALVEGELRQRGWPVRVLNGGVSGDTSAGGRARLAWLLRQQPQVVVLELGANDGLRGLPLEAIADNLEHIVLESRAAGARVLLAGMRVPPSYGEPYATGFAQIYPELAVRLEVALMPFLLAGVGGHSELNLPDGIHPNAAGHRLIAAALVPYLEAILAEVELAVAKEAA